METPFRPLVVGAPRSGFTLLASVVAHLLRLTGAQLSMREEVLRILLRGVGNHIASRIIERFAARGITDDLLYNPNFRYVVGGPKWIPRATPEHACFRKYIGVRGTGDFTLITRHPRESLLLDEVVHSHTDPKLWLEHPSYGNYVKFASVRNPVGILNSSVFSLNALASEYIQKFVPPEKDNDIIRQQLALYKFTDLNFFEGLVKFLIGYFDEFMPIHRHFILMRWEDLIDHPIPTILRLGRAVGINVTEGQAQAIWRKLDHVNLTQAHKHNYRVGHGIVGDWKNWITNEHLQILKEYDFEKYMIELGYGPIEPIDEASYTPFQRIVSECIRLGRIHDECPDRDLFTFAFNKSNIVSDKFPFKRYGWRNHTQIERSIFEDESLQDEIWDCADKACGEVNALLDTYLRDSQGLNGKAMAALLDHLQVQHQSTLGSALGNRYHSTFREARFHLNQGSIFHIALWKARTAVKGTKRKAKKAAKRVGRLASGLRYGTKTR